MQTDRFDVFYDGDCPLCRREIAMLQRLDTRVRLRFTDLTARNRLRLTGRCDETCPT